MKKVLLIVLMILAFCLGACGGGGGVPPVMPAYNGTAFYGDLVTEGCAAFTNGPNRAFTNDTSTQIIDRLQTHLADDEGKRIHILIGVNDVALLQTAIYNGNMLDVASLLTGKAVMFTSILPTYHTGLNADIRQLNGQLSTIAWRRYNIEYRDVYSDFADPVTGRLKTIYSLDGIRLTDAGCQLLFDGI